MHQFTPTPSLRFAVPPSLGPETSEARAPLLERFLSHSLGKPVLVDVARNYEALASELLSGRAEAGWAPPFVCARLEAMGVRILARGVRRGRSSYRSALVCRADSRFSLENLQGASAAWVDRDSVGGYLLALAFLKAKGLVPAKVFSAQQFHGSYQAALQAVAAGKADVAAVFAPPDAAGEETGISELLPERAGEFRVLAFTPEVPNDGVALSMDLSPQLSSALETALLSLHSSDEGRAVLHDGFSVERFEPAPRMGYRALYRVALASL